jgi:hypothetical protein
MTILLRGLLGRSNFDAYTKKGERVRALASANVARAAMRCGALERVSEFGIAGVSERCRTRCGHG